MPKVLFEDSGTGLGDQTKRDWADAAHFAALAHGLTDYVVSGFGISPDYTGLEATVASGQARMTVTDLDSRDRSTTGGAGPTTWPEATITAYHEGRTVSLTDTAVNDIYLEVHLSTGPDDARIRVYTGGSTPTADGYIHIATVDTNDDTTTTVNRAPSEDFESLSMSGDLTLDTGEVIADYANKEVPQTTLGGPASSLSAYPLATNTDTDHAATDHEAGGVFELTLGNLAGMGAAEIIIDTDINQPAAGTIDRVFIAEDSGRIDWDGSEPGSE
jgi:hypothetical protein